VTKELAQIWQHTVKVKPLLQPEIDPVDNKGMPEM